MDPESKNTLIDKHQLLTRTLKVKDWIAIKEAVEHDAAKKIQNSLYNDLLEKHAKLEEQHEDLKRKYKEILPQKEKAAEYQEKFRTSSDKYEELKKQLDTKNAGTKITGRPGR